MLLSDLPIELVNEILAYAIHVHPTPSNLLITNSSYLWLGLPLLQSHLRFRSAAGLSLFAHNPAPVVCVPRTITIDLSGGSADFQVFESLQGVLNRCRGAASERDVVGARSPRLQPPSSAELLEEMGKHLVLRLEELFLRLHSHARNPNLASIYRALILINPRKFTWTGPDPDHHFSIAIVPEAAAHLLRAVCTWTNLQHLVLTNISFSPTTGSLPLLPDLPPPDLNRRPLSLIPTALPSLETLLISQATFLPASAVAAMLALPGMERLERVRLVDAYEESIWGRRLRRTAVERAVAAVVADTVLAGSQFGEPEGADAPISSVGGGGGTHVALLKERIRKIVVCEARTERIMGGDRVEGTSILE